MELFTVGDMLHRNGIIIERARREGRSLNRMERNIILSGRLLAEAKGMGRVQMNEIEMMGEREKDLVERPIKVRAAFAFYWEIPGEQPFAEYLIRESNHPELPTNGHVDAESLLSRGVPLPLTPTYETWVKCGKKVVRS